MPTLGESRHPSPAWVKSPLASTAILSLCTICCVVFTQRGVKKSGNWAILRSSAPLIIQSGYNQHLTSGREFSV